MQKRKNTVTEKTAFEIAKSNQFIMVCAQLINTEHSMHLFDTKFKNPNINNHANKIKESAKAIQLHTASIIQFKDGVDREYTEQYCGELWRILRFLVGLDINQLEEFAMGLEKLNSEIDG